MTCACVSPPGTDVSSRLELAGMVIEGEEDTGGAVDRRELRGCRGIGAATGTSSGRERTFGDIPCDEDEA